MPKVTVYIRKEDYSKWQAIKEKTEFISNALNPQPIIFPTDPLGIPFQTDRPIKTVIKSTVGMKLCQHGFPTTFCRFAKPGKPCK